ncbi:MAG: amino acid adenylation domain-containing protein, partial [Cyclobacteriaceae bacterium]
MRSTDLTAFTGAAYEAHKLFWKAQLSKYAEGMIFRQYKTKTAAGEGLSELHLVLPGDAAERVNSLVGGNPMGVFTVMTACLGVLLNKYTGTSDIILDTPVLPGKSPGINNIVPIILPINTQETWKQHLGKVQGIIRETFRFQHYPLQLIKEKEKGSQLSYKTNIVIRSRQIHGEESAGSHDLIITLDQQNDQIGAAIRYNDAAFDEGFIKRFWDHLTNILAYLNRVEKSLAETSLYSDQELAEIRSGIESPGIVADIAENTMQAAFEKAVKKYEDSPALIFDGSHITYNDLNAKVNKLAHYLIKEHAISEGDIVGVMMPKSHWAVISILAIIKTGAAYLPVDPDYPEERKRFMLQDASIKVLLISSEDLFDTIFFEGSLIAADMQLDMLSTPEANPILSGSAPEIGYVIYTSGSSGTPKGVLVRQAGQVNMALDQIARFEISPEDRILQFASLSFDASVYEIFMALYSGAALVLTNKEIISNTATFEAFLAENKVSVATLPPAYLNTLDKENLASLRILVTAGEAAIPSDAIACSRFTNYYNAYGPTECSVCVSLHAVYSTDKVTDHIPIGKPISNLKCFVLDSNHDFAPQGLEGELCVAGVGLAKGYLNQPELTEKAFIQHERTGLTLYKTGDKVRINENGDIVYLGRIDNQLKVRGYRVEPDEIAQVLSQHEAITNAEVVKSGDDRLVAFVTPNPGKASPVIKLEGDGTAGETTVLPGGLLVHMKNKFETDFIFNEIFTEKIYHRHGISIKPGDTIIDAGANIGLFTIYAGLKSAGARIYAFEPVPEVHSILQENIDLYNLNATAFQFGLSDSNGDIDFTYYPNNTALSGQYGEAVKDHEVVKQAFLNRAGEIQGVFGEDDLDIIVKERVQPLSLKCQVKKLSDVIKDEGISKIDLLKIDVERAEWNLLKGIDEEDWQKIRQLVAEVHDEDGALGRLQASLEDKGFIVTVEQAGELEQTDLYNIYALRETPGEDTAGNNTDNEIIINSTGGVWTDPVLLSDSLKEYCSGRLPEYMVPSEIRLMDTLPLTSNGKVDKKQLVWLTNQALSEKSEIVEPETAIEKQLAAIWKSVLSRDRIGIHDDFFELGGHSLKATLFISRFYKESGITINLGNVFLNPTIAKLAKLVESTDKEAYSSIPAVPDQPYYPLSFAQRRLWILNQFPESRKAYLMPVVIPLYDLKPEVFREAVHLLAKRHESLRTNFVSIKGQPYQKIHDAEAFRPAFEIIDLRDLPSADAQIDQLITLESQKTFDLSEDPLFRIKLIRKDEKEFLMVLNMHHIITDGWSVNVLIKDLRHYYENSVSDKAADLKPLSIQYRDYAVWQHQQLEDGKLHEQENYWLRKLEGPVPILNMSTDYPRPAVKSYRGAVEYHSFSEDLKDAVTTFCDRKGVSPLMFLNAIVNTLLYRYTGQTDIILGTTVSGRDHPDLEDQNGFYVNTIAFRTKLDGDTSFDEVLENSLDTITGAFNHQAYPFDLLIEKLDLPRDTSRSPLFDVLLEVLNVNPYGSSQGSGDMGADTVHPKHITSKYDLSYKFALQDTAFYAFLEYNSDIFSGSRIKRMLGHLETLMAHVLQDSSLPLNEFNLLSDEERNIITGSFSTGVVQSGIDTDIDTLFRQKAVEYPDHIALIYEDQKVTYEELDRLAGGIANGLVAELPAGKGHYIGIMAEKSPLVLASVLAIARSGNAFVFIDPSYPEIRKKYIIEDAGIELLITDSGQMMQLGGFYTGSIYVIDIQAEAERNHNYSSMSPQPDDIAYLLYTSGSTGKPKGVKVKHKNLINYLLWANDHYFGDSPADSMVLFSSLSFDLTLTSLFSPLLRGGVLHIFPDAPMDRTLRKIFFSGTDIDAVKLTPSHIDIVGALGEQATVVSKVIVGGEALKQHHVRILTGLNSHIKIYNEYGPTETTIGSTVKLVSADESVITIGKPIANTMICLTDTAGNLMPLGFDGELYIGGEGVSAGYNNRPDLTSDRFAERNDNVKATYYRTGDAGRWLENGEILLTGRIDQQVKIRGYRIEPEEVESALISYSAIQNAAITMDNSGEESRMVAYFQSSEGQIDPEMLSQHMHHMLPAYMVPFEYIMVDSLPLTPNGKIDRKELETIKGQRLLNDDYQAPSTTIEKALADIWQEELKKDKIGVSDNFFVLGGHSLKATRIAMRIYHELGIEVDISTLFNYPTIYGLAEQLENSSQNESKPINPAPVKDYYVVTPTQKRLWITEQLSSEIPVYNSSGSYTIRKSVDRDIMQKVLMSLVERHEVLRTTFHMVDGELKQKIHQADRTGFQLMYEDFEHAADQEVNIQSLLHRESVYRFNLSQGPLIRVVLVRLGENDHQVIFTSHHIISDGWSLKILLKEFNLLYQAYEVGEQNPLSPLAIQYKDYAEWIHTQINSEAIESSREFWMEKFSGEVPVLDLPHQKVRPAVKSYRGAAFSLSFSLEEKAHLEAIARTGEASLFMTLLTVLKVLLFRYTHQEDLVVGTIESGRTHADIEYQVGIYLNTLALRTRVQPTESFLNNLEQVKHTVLHSYKHSRYPFDQLLEDLNISWNQSHSPLFDVLISLENTGKAGGAGEGQDAGVLSNIFDIVLNVKDHEEGLDIYFHYNTDIFSEFFIRQFASHYRQLAARVSLSDQQVRHIDYLSDSEREKLLAESTGESTAYPDDETIHGFVEKIVAAQPDHAAVVHHNDQISYKELDKRATTLAHYLVSTCGITPIDHVAIAADRSINSVVAFLAVLKSGSVYLPVDPGLPQERVSFMLKEAKVKLIITDDKHRSVFKPYEASVISIDDPLPEPDSLQAPDLVKVLSTDTAYIIYTSGSTGKPKGVKIAHHSNLNMALDQARRFGITHKDRMLQFASLSFDASVYEMTIALFAGATLVIADHETIFSTAYFTGYLSDKQVSVAVLPPSYVNLLDKESLKALRVLITAGEAAVVQDAATLSKSLDYYNAYGPTEAAVCVSVYKADKSDASRRSLPIGKPISNTGMFILDPFGIPVPYEVKGELYLAGPGLAHGYLERPDATEQAFVTLSDIPAERLYRSGDLAR